MPLLVASAPATRGASRPDYLPVGGSGPLGGPASAAEAGWQAFEKGRVKDGISASAGAAGILQPRAWEEGGSGGLLRVASGGLPLKGGSGALPRAGSGGLKRSGSSRVGGAGDGSSSGVKRSVSFKEEATVVLIPRVVRVSDEAPEADKQAKVGGGPEGCL